MSYRILSWKEYLIRQNIPKMTQNSTVHFMDADASKS